MNVIKVSNGYDTNKNKTGKINKVKLIKHNDTVVQVIIKKDGN